MLRPRKQAQSVLLLQLVTRGHPFGRDDVCPLPTHFRTLSRILHFTKSGRSAGDSTVDMTCKPLEPYQLADIQRR
jgi:hypothetical protein